jgi:predicted outer membrane repeat protein
MWLTSLLRKLTPTRTPNTRAAFRPRLEALEGRDVPSTLTVTNNLDSGPGSLRGEIAAAKNKDTIVFDPSSLKGQTITLTSGQLEISKSLTIQGLGASQLTVSGDSLSRVFQVDPKVTVTLSGMTISNGYAGALAGLNTYDGGGILNLGTLTVSSCTLSGNHADGTTESLTFIFTHGGGGIYNAGTLTVSNSTLTSNQAVDEGGGIFNAFRATATISGCTFFSSPAQAFIQWQSAEDGGAIFNAGTMTVNSCTFSYNFANYFGGAIYNAGELTVSNSVFIGNIAAPPGNTVAPPNNNNIYGLYIDGGGNTFA